MILILLSFADEKTKSKYERLYERYGNSLYRIIIACGKSPGQIHDATLMHI